MEADNVVKRQLSYEDLSASLTESLTKLRAGKDAGRTDQDFAAQLTGMASELEKAHAAMLHRLKGHRDAAMQQLEETGGRQALESHLKAQKANWKFLGQKEAFLEHLQGFADPSILLQHDFQADISLADRAVGSLKDDIKDRQASIEKVEQQLQGMIMQMARLYDQGASTAAKLAAQLPSIAKDLEEYQRNRPMPQAPIIDGMDEAELQRRITDEEALAIKLEQAAAADQANWADEDAQHRALAAHAQGLEAELAALQEAHTAQASQEGAKYQQQLDWYDTMIAAVAKLNGVELAGNDDNSMSLRITQHIPRGMPRADGSGGASTSTQLLTAADGQVVVHTVALEFEPGTGCALLRSAAVTPPTVDVQDEAVAARSAQDNGTSSRQQALSCFLQEVKAKIRHSCRRRILLEDANDRYPLQETSVSPELYRCVLPNRMEAEVEVPLGWPDAPGTALSLVQLQAPTATAAQDCGTTLARLSAALAEDELRQGSLRSLLDWVYSNVQ